MTEVVNTPFIPVFGTWGRDGRKQWWQDNSYLMSFLAQHSLTPVRDEDGRPFRWSGDLNGQWGWLRWFGLGWLVKTDHRDWQACGDALTYFMDKNVPYEARNLLVHSHGLQGILYCCADGKKIRRLVSMGSPYRKDMGAIIDKARPNIGEWIHVMDSHWDRMGQLGELGDGQISFSREHPAADFNVKFDGIGHSDMLTNPMFFPFWTVPIDPEHPISVVQFLCGASVRTAPATASVLGS